MKRPLVISASPHMHSGASIRSIMLDVLIALMPAAVASVLLFGWRAASVILVCVASSLAAEYFSRIVMKRPQTVGDLSAVVTGVLLAYNLPATLPLWQAAFGSVVAIVVAKQMFGGLGHNFVNPALTGRIVLMFSFPETMNTLVAPLKTAAADAVTAATPLSQLQQGQAVSLSLGELFLGLRSGSLGETCVLALLLGGVYLVIRRVISPLIPLTFIGTVFVMTWLLGEPPLVHILSGGLMIGAIFMATDYVTSPLSKTGKVVFAVGCGLLTVLFRLYGSLPEGVSYSIILMNILVPLIERVTRPLPFGAKRRLRHE
jgi:electron transport complex protein RnfD